MKWPRPLQETPKSWPAASFRSTKEQAVLGAVGLTPLTLESQYLKIQRRGECDCIERNLGVGASNRGGYGFYVCRRILCFLATQQPFTPLSVTNRGLGIHPSLIPGVSGSG